MKIKDIKLPKKGYLRINYSDLEANIFDDGREFCATSYDREWCCVGSIVDHEKNLDNENPLLQVRLLFKNVEQKEIIERATL